MDKLKEALGLNAEATDEETLAAVNAVVAERDSLKKAAADKAAEDFAENAVRDGKIAEDQKEAVKNAFLQSPEAAKAVLNAFKAQEKPQVKSPEKPQTVLNAGKDKPNLNARQTLAQLPPKERAAFYAEHKSEL